MPARLLVLAFLGSGLVLAQARTALACSCAPLPPGDPLQLAGRHLPHYDHAFIGTVERIGKPVRAEGGGPGYSRGTYIPVIVAVEAELVGEAPAHAILLNQSMPSPGGIGADCSYGFEVGRRYLVEAHRNADGTFVTNGCTFTQPYGVAAPPEPEASPPAQGGGRSALLQGGVVAGALAVVAGTVLVLTLRRRTGGSAA